VYTGFLQSNIVEGKPGVVETFVEVYGDVSGSTSGNGVMGMAGGVETSMGVCRAVCDEERESDDGQRERETHL